MNQKSQANFVNKTEQLIYYGEEMCIYCLTTTTSHRPSEASAKREFNVIEATINTLLGPSVAIPKVYIDNSIIEQLKSKFNSMIIQLVQSNQQEMVTSITSMQSTLDLAKSSSEERNRVLNCELPYSEWLYILTRDKLVPLGFVVDREFGDKPIVNSNELLGGRKDLLIYHPGRCEAVIEVLHIGVRPTPSDVLLDDSNTATIRKCNIYQGVAELKVASINTAAENECYYNMFAEAIKLTMKVLAVGRIVKKAIV